MNLVAVMGLRPLDRVQVNSRAVLAEFRIEQWRRTEADLPWWFFQRQLPDGRLVVRSPGGFCSTIEPTDVCDVLLQEPVRVRAMPRKTFLARLSQPLSDRGRPPEGGDYAPASVLYVVRDRWRRIDQVFVQFDDDALNDSDTYAAPIHGQDLAGLDAVATRVPMPVVSPNRTAPYSADKGRERAQQQVRYAAAQFLAAALAGKSAKRDALLATGLSPLTTAQINKL